MSTSLVFGLELATQTITWRGLFFNPFLNFATALASQTQIEALSSTTDKIIELPDAPLKADMLTPIGIVDQW
jgi:hypothetical protein